MCEFLSVSVCVCAVACVYVSKKPAMAKENSEFIIERREAKGKSECQTAKVKA